MKLAIVGDRHFTGYSFLYKTLKNLDLNFSEIVSGDASGVDRLAEQYARNNNIPFTCFKAEWDKYGRSAGPRRNTLIVENSDLILALVSQASRGTMNCINQALSCAKPIIFVPLPDNSFELRIR